MTWTRSGCRQQEPIELSVVILSAGVDIRMVTRCVNAVIDASSRLNRPAEIFFIDNASPNRIGELICTRYEHINVLRFDDRVGFCAANNAAFRLSRGQYITQLNDDTEVSSDALAELAKFLDAHPRAGAVGPRLETESGSLQIGYYARRLPTILYSAFHFFGFNRLWPRNPVNRRHLMLADEDQTRQIEQPAGAALTYRRTALFAIGLLDENFTFAFDDVDVCHRLLGTGWQVWYDNQARVVHRGAASLPGGPVLSAYTLNGILWYWSKHGSRLEYALLRLLLLGSLLIRTAVRCLPFIAHGGHSIGHYPRYMRLILASFFKAYTPQTLPTSTPVLLRNTLAEVTHG